MTILIVSAFTDEFVNSVGFINNLSFWALYLTTTLVEAAPTPFVWFEIKFKSIVSLFWRLWRVEPEDTVEIPMLTVILSTLPFTCSKLDSIEYSKSSKLPVLKNTGVVFTVKARPTISSENFLI